MAPLSHTVGFVDHNLRGENAKSETSVPAQKVSPNRHLQLLLCARASFDHAYHGQRQIWAERRQEVGVVQALGADKQQLDVAALQRQVWISARQHLHASPHLQEDIGRCMAHGLTRTSSSTLMASARPCPDHSMAAWSCSGAQAHWSRMSAISGDTTIVSPGSSSAGSW